MDNPAQMEQRLAAIEAWKEQLEKRLSNLDDQIAANTKTTNEIKKDTSQIVMLFQASQLGATIVKWCATVGGGVIIAYAAIKGLSGH